MNIGILIGDEPVSTPPKEHLDKLLRQVAAAQAAGVDTILIGQHFLYEDFRWLQPIPTLARIASETDAHVTVGPQIIISPLYDPVILAEELATLDVVTNGRLVVGLGVGYRLQEYDNIGVPFDERVSRFEEGVQLIRDVWTQEEISFRGKHYVVEGQRHITPIQVPHPPLWIGSQSHAGVRRAARLGGTWPITPQVPADQFAGYFSTFLEEARRTGQEGGRTFPIRREIMIGRDREDALSKFSDVARDRYLAYAARGMEAIPEATLRERFADAVTDHVVLGSAEDVIDQLTGLCRTHPVNPVIFRPHWPGMSIDRVEAYLEEMAREVIPALRELEPREPMHIA